MEYDGMRDDERQGRKLLFGNPERQPFSPKNMRCGGADGKAWMKQVQRGRSKKLLALRDGVLKGWNE